MPKWDMDDYRLPHKAKGIDGEDFAIEFRGDKIVFVAKSAGAGRHFTFQAGLKTGVIDLHETKDRADGQDPHRTLFAIRRDDLPACSAKLHPCSPNS